MTEKRKRSRDGCIICRKRRKRCDLRKPTCLGCERNVLLCRWASAESLDDQQALETEPVLSQPESPLLSVHNMGPSVASHVLNSPISSLLYEHYLQETGNAISAHRGSSNSFIRILPCLAMAYPNTVLPSLLALSGIHYGSRNSNIDVNIATFTHLGIALRSLKHSLTTFASSHTTEDGLPLLVTTLILCFLETIRPEQDGKVIEHIKAAHALFTRLTPPQEQQPVDEEVFEFLKEFYTYVKSITILSGSNSPTALSTAIESATSPLASQRSPGNLLGCSHELFNLVPHINALVNRTQNHAEDAPKDQADIEWIRSYTQLHTHLASWQPPGHSSADFALCGSMYQQALLCLIENASPLIDHRSMTAERVSHFVHTLESFPVDAPISATIVWPLVFFGALTSGQSHRELIYERLSHMWNMYGFGNIQSSMSFLRSYWSQQGGPSETSKSRISTGIGDLSSIMKQMGLNISLL